MVVININTEDEAVLNKLPGVTFIEARRICMARPFQNEAELLQVRGLSQNTIQQWQNGGFEIAFEDPFLAFERAQQDSALISMQSPAPSIPSPNPLTYSPAPSNSSPAPRRNSQPTPASRRPPLPRPRRPSIKTQGNGQSNQVKTPPEISEQKTKSSERKTSKESLNSTMTEVPSASSPAVEKLVALLYRQQDARLRRIAVSRMLRTVTAVIEAWRGHLQERQRCDQAEYGIILRRLRTSLHDALSEWLVYGRKANRLRKLGVRMLSRVLERVTSSAFRRWQSVCHGLSAMGATYANLLARCYTHCLMDHFEAWRDFTSHNRRQAHMMRRAASAWLHLRLRSAWNAWQMTCQTRRRLRGIALTVTYNWLHVRVGPILNAWQQHAMLAERVAMMRMRNAAARDAASLKGCLQHWRALSSKEVVEYLQKKIIRWMMGSLSENFVAWHEHTVATRRWAIALSRAVLKMQQKLSYGTFYRWKQKLELKSKARLVLVRIMQFQLIKAMERWRRQTASEVDLKMKMEKVVIRWRSFGIRVALLRWRKQAALRRTAFHSVQRLINRGLLESFEIWRRRVGWQIQLKLKAGKAMMRLFNRLLVQGFDRWRQQVEDEIQLKRKALKVVQRMMNRELVESFDRWHWVLQRSIHLHETGIRILVASMERHLRHVFIAWQLASVRSKLWLNVQRKVMKIDTRVLYQNHFDAWRDMVGNRTRELFKLIEGWKEYRNPAGREGAMLVRILYGWRGVAKDSVQVRHAGVKVLLRWLAMGVRQSFMHWRGRADLKKQALMVVRRLMNRGLVSAFERWVTQALEEKQLRHKAFKVVHRLMNRVQVQGFERWREQAVEEKQLKLKALKVVQRMKGLWLAMALDRWKTETFMQAQDKSQSMSWQEVVLQIGLRWTTAQLSAVFRQWHNISKFLRSREIHYVRARRRIVWNCKRSTMLEWSVYTYEARRLWHAGSVILSRWTSALLTSALSGWMDCVAHDKAKLAAVTMAVAKQDVAIALPDPDCLRQAEQARENMESFSTQENQQPLDVATAIAPQADTDGWSRVIASLSTDQRIGLHMLGMHRTWQAVSSIFSAWASILKRRGSTGASHTVSADRAPLEPDFSPRQLDLGLSPQSQSHYMRADMHPHTTPQLTPADLERSAYTQTVEDNSDPQSLPYKPPPPPTPSLAALQPHGALSIYSTALHPSTSSSTVIPAVVMSNFPRQQFTPVSAEEREDSQATPRHTDTRLPLSPSVAGGGLTHFSPSKVLSPRTIVMSPPQATNCSRSSRESGDEKGAKLGQPVTQSLVMPPPRPGLQVDAQGAGDNAKNDPLIYLL